MASWQMQQKTCRPHTQTLEHFINSSNVNPTGTLGKFAKKL
jgi:hypothetical protein